MKQIYICPYIYDHLELIQKKIREFHFKLFASKNYLKKFGVPKKYEDLNHHRLIAFSKELQNPYNDVDSLLHLGCDINNPRDIFLEANSSIGLLKLVKDGVGIASLFVDDGIKNNLVELFGEKENIPTTPCLIYNKKNHSLRQIKVIIDVFLNEKT